MKTWEMIKELTENPEKKFRMINNKEVDAKIYVGKFGHLCAKVEPFTNQSIWGNVKLEDEWEEVREPVPFMEIVETQDAKVMLYHPEINITQPTPLPEVFEVIVKTCPEEIRDIILNGEWYVE